MIGDIIVFGVSVGLPTPSFFSRLAVVNQHLLKQQITVAICCQGNRTTTASLRGKHPLIHPQSDYSKWFICSPQLSFKITRLGLFGLDFDDTSKNPVSAVRAMCFGLLLLLLLFFVFFRKMFLPLHNFAQKCKFGCIIWIFFFLVNYFGGIF